MDGIEKETYMDADQRTQAGLNFDMLSGIARRLDIREVEVDKEICNLKKRRKTDRYMNVVSGFAGGFFAVLAKIAIWK